MIHDAMLCYAMTTTVRNNAAAAGIVVVVFFSCRLHAKANHGLMDDAFRGVSSCPPPAQQ
jgi:hypothetical protein